ncbi:hypothetical protein [Chondromyces crocatus]|uniref:Uncharacterized protein n=1 Tax=Chondromyces crocatus TaxID=52 RepID=A0A0K1EFG8_CHOCO|nr:hypothetical protein [Chondromyces crocatus]AKT39605.1 uncharacterized protein CMC5_037540 [Chondromyces crocatus]
MPSVLLVPMHLDALVVPRGETRDLHAPLVDFTKLPFTYNTTDPQTQKVSTHDQPNSTTPSIADLVLTAPFDNAKLTITAGIHLHWALPDALTNSKVGDDAGRRLFPIVPNRWLVNRVRNDATIEAQWVVESDYLYPDLSFQNPPPDTIAVQFPCIDPDQGPYQPFRHMGRAVEASAWSPNGSGEYLGQFEVGADPMALTAVGTTPWVDKLDHVKASFAAFYPNSHSVFGFHDTTVDTTNLAGLSYEVIGFYGDLTQDFMGIWRARESDPSMLLEDLQNDYAWSVDVGDDAFPDRTVLYSRMTFGTTDATAVNPAATGKKLDVSLANSGTEALSAYLAKQLATTDGTTDTTRTPLFEQQLEALEYVDALSTQRLDQVAKFLEARHQKGFTSQAGGFAWSIRPANQRQGESRKIQTQVTLPDDLAHQLNQLNALQERYNRTQDEIASMSGRLFRDWVQLESTQTEPSVNHSNALESLIGTGLSPLRTLITSTGFIQWSWDGANQKMVATPEAIVFSIVSARSKYYGQYYVPPLNDGSLLHSNAAWRSEIENCGRTWGANAKAINEQTGATQEGKVWTIPDGDLTYQVTVARGVMNLVIPPDPSQLASQLITAIASLRETLAREASGYVLIAVPQPRYWQPNEPTLLLVGDAIRTTLRHGCDGDSSDDGYLHCQHLPDVADDSLSSLPTNAALLQQIRGVMDAASPSAGGDAPGFTTWTAQPWNPVLAVWNMEFFPDTMPDANYPADYITSQYTLPRDQSDLAPTTPQRAASDERPYAGFGILSPHAPGQLQRWIANLITREHASLPAPYDDEFNGLNTEEAMSLLDQSADAILAAYQPTSATDPIVTALRAHSMVARMPCLSQAFGGFNDTLCTANRGTMQLEIADPTTTNEDLLQVTTQVNGTVRAPLLTGPLPMSDFTPIRSGQAKLARLWVVDAFGQVNPIFDTGLAPTNATSTQLMPTSLAGTDCMFRLPPRLTQPARLSFRWLSGEPVGPDDDVEMNAHPATTPVCGWVLPNHLDSSLMIYDADGATLGVVDQEGHWSSAPGRATPVSVADIANPHLRSMVTYLTKSASADTSFLRALLLTLGNALENSDPEDFAQHKAMALLVGRPLALVRAKLKLELKGLPARDESLTAYKASVAGYDAHDPTTLQTSPTPWTHDFDKVLFPIRIGECGQYNDGLAGYWKENDDGSYAGDVFYSTQSDAPGLPATTGDPRSIVTVKDAPVNIPLSASADALTVAMLLDPRGKVHATSGILPTKALSIPSDQYAAALQVLTVTFLSAPLLTTRAMYEQPPETRQLELQVPTEGGYAWSWLEQSGGQWTTSTGFAPVDTTARFAGEQLLCEGWLELAPTSDASDTSDTSEA